VIQPMRRGTRRWAIRSGMLLVVLLGCDTRGMARNAQTKGGSMEQRVEQAFAALRKGDGTPAAELASLGPALVPALGKYVDDPSEDVRGQVVALLGVVKGPGAIPLLVKALGDSSLDIEERAAVTLHSGFSGLTIAADKAAGAALRAAVKRRATAAAILLLANFPGKETMDLLAGLERDEQSKTKLQPGGPVVSVALPSLIAGSRSGRREARQALLARLAKGTLEELRFTLLVLADIDAPEVLHALGVSLQDEREIAGGLPSGAAPPRRLCDLAVDALAKRLQLRPRFALNEARRYSPEQRTEIEHLLRAAIPQ
jgi:hypothetical protein